MLGPNPVRAQDATWTGSADSNWNNDINWSPASAPAGTATFSAAPTTSLTFSSRSPRSTPCSSRRRRRPIPTICSFRPRHRKRRHPQQFVQRADVQCVGPSRVRQCGHRRQRDHQQYAGATTFTGTSTAENATVANSFSAVPAVVYRQQHCRQRDDPHARLCQTQFASNSTGGNARLITAGGIFDFSLSSGPAGDNKSAPARSRARAPITSAPTSSRSAATTLARRLTASSAIVAWAAPNATTSAHRRRTGQGRHRHDDPGRRQHLYRRHHDQRRCAAARQRRRQRLDRGRRRQ